MSDEPKVPPTPPAPPVRKKRVCRALTVKQRKFVHEKFEGKSNAEAVFNAGYNTTNVESARVIAKETLQKENVQQYMDRLFEEEFPASDRTLIQKIKDHIDVDVSTLDPAQKSVHLKALDLYANLRGRKAAKKVGHAHIHVKSKLPGTED